MIKQIAYAGYPVTNIAVSRKFYEELFDLKPDNVMETPNGSWVEYNIGAEGCLLLGKHDGWMPSKDGPNAALEVDNFDEIVERVRKMGIAFTMEPVEFPVCHMAIFQDPDGNSITLHQRK